MRHIDHFIAGGKGSTRTGFKHQVWNPSIGEVHAEVALGDAALLDLAVAQAMGGAKNHGVIIPDSDQYGMECLRFWTKAKKITQRWPDGANGLGGDVSNAFLIPTMG